MLVIDATVIIHFYYLLLLLLFVDSVHCFHQFGSTGTTTTTGSIHNPLRFRIRIASTTTTPKMTTTTMDATSGTSVTHEERLQIYLTEHGISELPPAPKAAANYCPCQRSGELLYLSGHLPFSPSSEGIATTTLEPYVGRLGNSLQDDAAVVALGYDAARQAGLNIIATLRAELGGSINDVDQIIKLFGLVQSQDDFHQQHLVMNGCSDLMTNVFGPIAGKHARSAVGTNALPLNSMIEIEAIVCIKPSPL
jgi:enamine deaminase RidA (YjgF/YER057c/UK114 family)